MHHVESKDRRERERDRAAERELAADLDLELEARERRVPLWARVAPVLYLGMCSLAVRQALASRTSVSITGILIAIGLVAVFALPAAFATTRARIAMTEEGLRIDGRVESVDVAELSRAERGEGTLRLVLRGNVERSFEVSSFEDARRLVARLPPASLPAAALAA